MSDSWVLCPKCGEEVEYSYHAGEKNTPGEIKGFAVYFCPNCQMHWRDDEVVKKYTEYLKGEEDEKGNQSRRSKE